jgi:hypothetical protein
MDELKRLKEQYASLPDDPSSEVMENTAHRLRGMKFSPTLLVNLPDFLHVTKERILGELDRALTLDAEELIEEGMNPTSDPETFRMNHLKLLYYFYELLTRLRRDDPAAWDEINELYEDD